MEKIISKTINDELVQALTKARTVAVCCHVNPDGDTIGSALALRLGLLRLGKQVRVFCADKVPDLLSCLPGQETVEHEVPADARFDLVCPVDISDDYRMGSCKPLLDQGEDVVLIDHHGTNPGFARVNVIDGDAPACCLLIKVLLERLGVTVDRDIAVCLYAGISTDTGNFSFGNTTAEAFRATAELMETGLPLAELNRVLFRQRDVAQLLLIRAALETLRFAHGQELAYMTLTQADFAACGARGEHADTVVNFGMDLKGAKMALLAREAGNGEIKLSLRAIAPWRVDEAAHALGGGGHAQAAGATLHGTLAECTERAVAEMVKYL